MAPLTVLAEGVSVALQRGVAETLLPVVSGLAPGPGRADLLAHAEWDAPPVRVVAPLRLAAVVVTQAVDLEAPNHGAPLQAGRAHAARVVEVHLTDGPLPAAGLEAGVDAHLGLAGLGNRAVVVGQAFI